MRAGLRFLPCLGFIAMLAWGGVAVATPDDTLVIGYSRAANNLQPGVNAALPNIWANMLIYDSLVIHDAQGKVHPALARRWEVSKDGLVWTFHLRDDVTFHSGRRLTANDVKAHFDLWKTMPTATKIAALERTGCGPGRRPDARSPHRRPGRGPSSGCRTARRRPWSR